jgi:hypothetical protein
MLPTDATSEIEKIKIKITAKKRRRILYICVCVVFVCGIFLSLNILPKNVESAEELIRRIWVFCTH